MGIIVVSSLIPSSGCVLPRDSLVPHTYGELLLRYRLTANKTCEVLLPQSPRPLAFAGAVKPAFAASFSAAKAGLKVILRKGERPCDVTEKPHHTRVADLLKVGNPMKPSDEKSEGCLEGPRLLYACP